MTADSPDASARPTLRIVHGSPSPEELAVLTALLASSGGPAQPTPPRVRSRWADPASRVRKPLRTGPGAWVASGR